MHPYNNISCNKATKPLKPFQGLKPLIAQYGSSDYSYKTSETLLGIETTGFAAVGFLAASYKTSETLLGIETKVIINQAAYSSCYKTSETLLGIETLNF